MAREVRHAARGPAILDENDVGDDGKIFVCRCGLTDDPPFCDGSHNRTHDEEEGVVYRYEGDDDENERRIVEGFEFADG